MNIYKLIGYLILLLPFIAVFVVIAKQEGLKAAFIIFFIGICTVSIMKLGEYLITLD